MKIAVFFPGIGYHCDKPLLYYSRKLASELGYEEIICLEYSYTGGNVFGNLEKMKEAFDVLYEQAALQLGCIEFEKYDEVLFVSKSVGTMIASKYAACKNFTCRHILYTPLEYTFDYPHDDGIAFIGTADSWSNTNAVVDLAREQNVCIYSYDGLNHSLETNDVMKNINTISDVMEKTAEYIKSNGED